MLTAQISLFVNTSKKAYATGGGRLYRGITDKVYRIYEGSEFRQVGNSTGVMPTGGGSSPDCLFTPQRLALHSAPDAAHRVLRKTIGLNARALKASCIPAQRAFAVSTWRSAPVRSRRSQQAEHCMRQAG